MVLAYALAPTAHLPLPLLKLELIDYLTAKSVSINDIPSELETLISEAGAGYTLHEVDKAEIEQWQQTKLGHFYKRPLPHGTTATGVNMALLGNMLDKEPTTKDGETLSGIVESDCKETTDFSVVTMIARPGSGKTATVAEVAKKHYVIYCVCTSLANTDTTDFRDRNFSILTQNVIELAAAIRPAQTASDVM
ncbi:hypothetical protein BGX21_007045, partial [Mortierella sp. AD011]